MHPAEPDHGTAPMICPTCKSALTRNADNTQLRCSNNHAFAIQNGIAHLLPPQQLNEEQQVSAAYYENVAEKYDDIADLSFRIQCQDETSTRLQFVELLKLKPDAKVLEIACGTGRDSINIIAKLDARGEFYGLDFSPAMLERCREKIAQAKAKTELTVGSAISLPFADGYFDAVFSFGGLNVFGDLSASFREIVRVCKPGAHVVAGDESLAPWLYDSEYGRILLANNPLFKYPLPLQHLPVEARLVRLQWVIGGVYYLIDFEVGQGEPPADFDIPIPGERGGTLRTRYYGKLEGVTPQTLELARQARKQSGKSMHDWLEQIVREAALRELSPKHKP